MSGLLQLMVNTSLGCALLAGLVCPRAAGAQALSDSHPKHITAQRVFDDLVRAIGDGRTAPKLRLVASGSGGGLKVAWYSPKKNRLTIEEKAFDLAAAMGADSLNALAALIGHELAHFYKDHGWAGDFGNGFADLEVGQRVRTLEQTDEQIVKYESEADYFGGFFGYLAGYNTLGVTDAFLGRVYDEYDLGDDIQGYPSLGDRMKIAAGSERSLRQLLPVFESAIHLLVLGEFEAAADCFEFIARDFPSREILNNAGVARAMEAISLFPGGELRYAYPVELDGESRLAQGQVRGGSSTREVAKRREKLLVAAKTLFQTAHLRDAEYTPAIVNLACVAQLAGNAAEALVHAQEAVALAKSQSDKVSLANAHLIRGIIRADNGETGKASADFERAQAGNPSVAKINQLVLGGGTADSDYGSKEKLSTQREQPIGDGTAEFEAIVSGAQQTKFIPMSGENNTEIMIMWKQLDGGDGYIIDTGPRRGIISVLSTGSDHSGHTARGIGIGGRLAEIEATYGRPHRIVSGRQGTHHFYEQARIAFFVNSQSRVEGWVLFDVEQGEFYQPVAEKAQKLSREPRLALVIGNSSYGAAPLDNTINDARDIAAALGRCGFDVILRIDANRKLMRSAIREFGGKLKKGGVGLFYYAGHGVQVHGRNYLVPVSADIRHEDEVEDESVLVSSVLGKMETASNRINIVILDACRNNPYARSFRSHTQGLVEIKIGFPRYDGSLPNATTGSLVAYSTEPGQVAADGKERNGLYTSKLLRYLETPGMDAHDLFMNVRRDVIHATSGKQIPWESSSLTGDFYFLPREGEFGFSDNSTPLVPALKQPPALNRYQAEGELHTAPVTFEEMVYVADFGFHIDLSEVTNFGSSGESVGERGFCGDGHRGDQG